MKTENRKERISSFEDLEAWQMARQLVNSIYALTRVKSLAVDFRLCSQVQAAGVSIMSNIAEGFERTHLQEKIQFYNVARGSAGEVRLFTVRYFRQFRRGCSGSRTAAPGDHHRWQTCYWTFELDH